MYKTNGIHLYPFFTKKKNTPMRRYELKHSNDNDAPRVVTGCFGSGQQRGSVDNNVSSVDNNDTKEEMKNEENKKEDEEDSSVIRQQLSDVANIENGSYRNFEIHLQIFWEYSIVVR